MKIDSNEKASKNLKRWQLGLFGLIVISAVFLAAMEKSDRIKVLSAADFDRARVSAEIIQGASADLAMERGLVYLALHLPVEQRGAWRLEIQNRRSSVDQALNAAMAGFIDGRMTKTSWPVGRMNAQLKHLERLRTVTDRQLAAPLSEQSGDLAEVWFREVTASIKNLNTVLQVLHSRLAYADPNLRFALRLQRYAGNIAELAGRERALIAAAVAADEPLSSRQLTMLRSYRLYMVEDWRRITLVANSLPISAELSDKLAAAQDQYARVLINLAEQMVNERNLAGAFPLSAEFWLDESSRAIDSILEVGAIAVTDPRGNVRFNRAS